MIKLLLLATLTIALCAKEPPPDPMPELQQALQGFLLFLQQAQKSVQELAESDQQAIPEEKEGFTLYHKRLENEAQVQKRNDLLVKTQIEYKFFKEKSIPTSTTLVIVRNGNVELYGKLHSIEAAKKAMELALSVKGVKSVTSYLIIKEPAKIKL
jgi:osmotically-inducible protein OsmY